MDDVVLSDETLTSLRSEQFDVKRWVSKALVEASSSPSAVGASMPSALGKGTSPSGSPVDAVPARNATTLSAPEYAAQRLVTLLGVRKQAASETLEETISNALRTLPRATEDIGRLATETGLVKQRLQGVTEATLQVNQSDNGLSRRLHELHDVRGRLVRCRTVLNDAQLLASRAATVEQAIGALYGTSVSSPRGPAPANSSPRPLAIKSTVDTAEFDRLADDVAAMKAALRTLHDIDPSYGASLRSQVQRFEHIMLEGLEAQCMESLKKEDRDATPGLLAALRKIGRDTEVLRRHCDQLAIQRLEKLRLDHLQSSAPDKQLPALRRAAHGLVKALIKDRSFFNAVCPHNDNDEDEEGTNEILTPGRSDEVTASFVTGVLRRAALEVRGLLSSLSNDSAIATVEIVEQEFVRPLLDGGSASLSVASSKGVVNHHTVASLAAPFVDFIPIFVERESAALRGNTASLGTPKEFMQLEDELKTSCRRVAAFLAAVLKLDPSSVTEATARAAMDSCTSLWNGVGESYAAAVAQNAHRTPSLGGASRAALESSLSFYAHCVELPMHAARLEEDLEACLRPALTVLCRDADVPSSRVFAPAAAAMARLPATCRDAVLAIVLETVPAMVPEADVLRKANPSAGQSESVRAVGEWVMELPMTLENAGLVSEVQDWVAAAVAQLVTKYCGAVRELAARGLEKRQAEMLLSDAEYLETVVNTLDESPSNRHAFADLRRILLEAPEPAVTGRTVTPPVLPR